MVGQRVKQGLVLLDCDRGRRSRLLCLEEKDKIMGDRSKQTRIPTVFIVDGNCVSRLVSLLVIWDHHWNI